MTSSPSLGEGPRAGPLRLVLSTFPDPEAAEKAARRAVRLRLAACATILPGKSIYAWKGAMEEAEEQLVLFKTSTKKLGALFTDLARHHPYEVPEVLEVQTFRVHEPYLLWALDQVDRTPKDLARAAGALAALRPARRRRRSR